MWPSERRWLIAWSAATASSHETRGNGRPSIEALTITVGRRRSASRVVVVRCVGLGVEPAGEDDARDAMREQELDVVGLGHATGGLRAQDRGEALLGERAADDLGEGREDRVLELGEDEADEAGALAAELGRALVAEDIERGQDRLPGRFRRRPASRSGRG